MKKCWRKKDGLENYVITRMMAAQNDKKDKKEQPK